MLVMSELLHISLFHPFDGFEKKFTDTCNYLYNLQIIDFFSKNLDKYSFFIKYMHVNAGKITMVSIYGNFY
jgi:hypothetical protein